MYRSRAFKLRELSKDSLIQRLKRDPTTFTPIQHTVKDRVSAKDVLDRLLSHLPPVPEVIAITIRDP